MASGPAELAQRALFEPVAQWLERCTADALPDCEQLNGWSDEPCAHRSTGLGAVRFVIPDGSVLRYEERIHSHREIVTRPNNWHDFFNALVWLRFPLTKRALNDAHVRHMRQHQPGRGPVRDAVTQFDESGVAVASADARLLNLLAERRWKELFWTRRAQVVADMRFLVFGHGLYDALRAPFYRICGRAALFTVDRATLESDVVAVCAAIDRLLAARFAHDHYPRPRALLALPVLAIPGMTADNESPAYYEDRAQFRPLPAWASSPAP